MTTQKLIDRLNRIMDSRSGTGTCANCGHPAGEHLVTNVCVSPQCECGGYAR